MASFGEILKRERELRGISLREISEATKITTRHLQALEDSRINDLPGGLFNKGFIRAYALHVGIDPEEMVNNYLYDVGQLEEQDPLETLRALIPAEQNRPAVRWRQWAILAAIFTGGLLLFAGLSYWPLRGSAPTIPVAGSSLEPGPGPPAMVGEQADPGAAAAPGGNVIDEAIPVPAPGDGKQQATGAGLPTVAAARPQESDDPPAPTTAEPQAEPPARPPADSPARPAPAEVPIDLNFEMEMRHPARVRILCDGNEVLNKRLGTGERRMFTCRDLRISASDAAALRYRVNDTGWVIPEGSGRPLENLHLTPADNTDLQPGRERGAGRTGTAAERARKANSNI